MAAELSFSTDTWFIKGWYNDDEVLGGCDLWDDFSLNNVPKMTLRNSPEAIQFVSMTWPLKNISNFTCTTKSEVDGILTALSDVSPTLFSCGGHVWIIAECIAGSPSICVDCLDPCMVQTSRCTDASVELSLSPCSHAAVSDDSCSYPIGLANMLSITFSPLAPAPSILSVASTDITSSSIEVLIELSLEGYVHCLAMSGGVAPTSAEEIPLLGVSSSSLNVSTKLRFGELLSAVEYNVYCSVESIDGTISSLSEVMASAITVMTSCCKDLFVSTSFYTPFVKGIILSDIIELSVAQLPTDSIMIGVNIFFNNTGNETVHNESSVIDVSSALHPSSKIYFGNTPQENVSLSMNALSHVGRYWVSLNVSGPSSSQYVIDFDGLHNFEVVEFAIEPPLPVIQSSHFVRDGSAVRVVFNASTDMNGLPSGNFDCSRLFNFTASVGTKCKWISSAEVLIFSKVLNVAEHITLFGSKLRARCVLDDCSHWKTVNETAFEVSSPPSVKAPILSVVASAFLGKCDDLSIDISSTSGSLGRPWADLTLKIVTSNDLSSKVADIQSILDGVEMNDYKKPIIIARSYLTATKSYSIQISIRNFLGGTATKTFTTTVLASSAPTVSIWGPSRREIQRRSAVVLTADAYTILCSSDSNESSVSQVGLEYNWKVYGSAGNPISDINSELITPSKLRILSYELEANNLYSIEVTVFDSILRISSSSSVSVFVKASDVVAIISQGSQLALPVDKEVLIDGSRSYDTDKSVTPYSDFSYTWSCTKVSPTLSDACPLEFDITSEGNGVYVKAGTGAINSTSLISLLIVAQDLRTSSASILVDTVSPKSPFSSIDFDGSSLSKFNPDKKIIVRASVVTDEPCLMEWGIREEGFEVNPEFDFDSNTLTPTSRMLSLRQSQSQTSISSNLVIKPGALLGGTSYMLTLSCTNDFVSSQTLKITLNSPPQIGSLDITPAEGTALSTIFLFDAALWEDEDLPLTYEFGVKSNNVLLPLQTRSEVKTLSSRLSEGKDDKDYAVNVVLTVYDDLSSNATDTHEVTVTPLADELDSILNLFSDSGNMSQSDLSATTSTLNVNNCSLSPNCADLFRHECTVVPHTCGDCIDGYVGDNGVNSECILESVVGFLRKGRVGERSIVYHSCDECGLWETCGTDPVSGDITCERTRKSCSDPECSSHGSCIYYSTVSPFEQIGSCLVGSLDCDVRCQCDAGYSGVMCTYTEIDFEKKISLRRKSSISLLNIILSEEVTEESVLSNIESIEALFQEKEEISLDMAHIAVQILDNLISNCGEYELSSDKLEKMIPPLNTILRLYVGNGVPTAEVFKLVDSLAYLIAADMVVGESTRDIAQEFIRIHYHGVELANVNFLTLERARTKYEKSLELPVNSISFSTVNFREYMEVINWLTTINSSNIVDIEGERIYNSEILSVRSIYSTSKTQAIKLFDKQDFTVELLNTESVVYDTESGNPSSYTISTVCGGDSSNTTEMRVLKCPGSGYQHTVSCDSGLGTYTFTCPQKNTYEEPNCAQIDESWRDEFTAAECGVVWFNEHKTVCSCNIDKITERDHATRTVPREMEMAAITEVKIIIDSSDSTIDFVPKSLQSNFAAGTMTNRIFFCVAMLVLLFIIFAYTRAYSESEKGMRRNRTQATVPISDFRTNNRNFPSLVHHGLGNLSIASTLVEKAVPDIFHFSKDLSGWNLFINEIWKHHKWAILVKIIDFRSGTIGWKSLFQDIMFLFTHILTVLTSLTVIYVIYDESNQLSDFECKQFATSQNCTASNIAGMGLLGNFCDWEGSTGSCSTRTPSSGIWSVVVGVCLAMLLSTPVTAVINWLVSEFLMANTDSGEFNDFKSVGCMRFVPGFIVEWVIRNQTLSSFGTTYVTLKQYGLSKAMLSVMKKSMSDFIFLKRKVSAYSCNIHSVTEKELFLRNWGEDVDIPHSLSNTFKINKEDDVGDSTAASDISGDSEYYSNEGLFSFFHIEVQTSDTILRDLIRANIIAIKESKALLHKLQYKSEPLEEVRVLRLLCDDLLSDEESRIFRAKCYSEDISMGTSMKSLSTRVATIVIVGLYYVAAICIVVFYGLTRDVPSQLLWGVSSLVWLLLDVMVCQTTVVMLKEMCIPSLISRRVSEIEALIARCICQLDLCNASFDKFKWSLMLFSSARVASKFYASRLGELILTMALNIPRRSLDISSYSHQAIYLLNVHNSDSRFLTYRKNKSWNSHSPLVLYVSYICDVPFIYDVFIGTSAVAMGSVTILILLRIYLMLGLTMLVIVTLGIPFCVGILSLIISCHTKKPRKKSIIDREEKMLNELGKVPYIPKGRIGKKNSYLKLYPHRIERKAFIGKEKLKLDRFSSESTMLSSGEYNVKNLPLQSHDSSVSSGPSNDDIDSVDESLGAKKHDNDEVAPFKSSFIDDISLFEEYKESDDISLFDNESLSDPNEPISSVLLNNAQPFDLSMISMSTWERGGDGPSVCTEKGSVSSDSTLHKSLDVMSSSILEAKSMTRSGKLPPINLESEGCRKVLSAIKDIEKMPLNSSTNDMVNDCDNQFVKVIKDLDEDSIKNRFKPKPRIPEDLRNMLSEKSPDEKLRIIFHLADQTVINSPEKNVFETTDSDLKNPKFSNEKNIETARNQVLEAVVKKKLLQIRQVQVKSTSPASKLNHNELEPPPLTVQFQQQQLTPDENVILHRNANSPFNGSFTEERKILKSWHQNALDSSTASDGFCMMGGNSAGIEEFPSGASKISRFVEGHVLEGSSILEQDRWLNDEVDADVDDRLRSFSTVIDDLEHTRRKREKREEKRKQAKIENE